MVFSAFENIESRKICMNLKEIFASKASSTEKEDRANLPVPNTEALIKEILAKIAAVVLPVGITIIGFIIVFGLYLTYNLGQLSTNISVLKENIDSITPEVKKYTDDAIRPVQSQIDSMKSDIDTIKEDFYRPFHGDAISSDLIPSPSFISYASASYTKLDSPIQQSNVSFLTSASIVAYSPIIDTSYTVTQVTEEKLLLPYIENGQEVYFYGQLSEQGNWDGNCIVNIYDNNELQFITDALYDDGELLTCRQVFLYQTTGAKTPVWGVSKRTIKNDFNSGETYYYYREGNYVKNFSMDNVTSDDIFSADEFCNSFINGYLEGYYCGNTSDGYFNDESGTAYMKKYFQDGTIRTLYVGNFVHGQFDDISGSAWIIGRENENTPYGLYNGRFVNGVQIDAHIDKFWNAPLSLEDIESYLTQCGIEFIREEWGDSADFEQ